MIDFMVISGERSGSTWAANWLTTDTTLCIHDPLRRYSIDQLEGIYADFPFDLKGRKFGIACTALQLLTDYVNRSNARKVIVHRPDEEIAAAWMCKGIYSYVSTGTNARLHKLYGMHVPYTDLFDPHEASFIATWLGVPFDERRHEELVQMNIQPHLPAVKETPEGVTRLLEIIRNNT